MNGFTIKKNPDREGFALVTVLLLTAMLALSGAALSQAPPPPDDEPPASVRVVPSADEAERQPPARPPLLREGSQSPGGVGRSEACDEDVESGGSGHRPHASAGQTDAAGSRAPAA